MTIKAQVHDKFKVFIPSNTHGVDDQMIAAQVMAAEWSKGGQFAPKSVGVEYLEAKKQLVLSIGYRDDVPGYPVALTAYNMGHLDLVEDQITTAMNKAAAAVSDVICHEFYVTEDGEFVMVFMSHG